MNNMVYLLYYSAFIHLLKEGDVSNLQDFSPSQFEEHYNKSPAQDQDKRTSTILFLTKANQMFHGSLQAGDTQLSPISVPQQLSHPATPLWQKSSRSF